MASPPSDLIDVYAAAAHLDVAPATVRSWVLRYSLPCYGREGRRALYSLADLYASEVRARVNAKRMIAVDP